MRTEMKMNRTLIRVVAALVIVTFTFNEIAYGMSPALVSGSPGDQIRKGTRDAMHAFGQKLFAAKKGPGSIDFDAPIPRKFTGEAPSIKGVRFVETNWSKPPAGWENNPILAKTNIVEAFEYFRNKEARISDSTLKVEVGYFTVNDKAGELPIANLEENSNGKFTLVIHYKFAKIWEEIRKNDIWFEADFENDDGSVTTRTVSVAWALFYRVAKHEMADLYKLPERSSARKGQGGHLSAHHPGEILNTDIAVTYDELQANMIGGRYSLVNDGIWLWLLGSYCFANSTRYDNAMLRRRINWFFKEEGKREEAQRLYKEFPNLLGSQNAAARRRASRIARFVNYHYFSRPADTGRGLRAGLMEALNINDIKVPDAMVKEFLRKSLSRKVPRDLPAKGADETPAAPAPETAPAAVEPAAAKPRGDASWTREVQAAIDGLKKDLTWAIACAQMAHLSAEKEKEITSLVYRTLSAIHASGDFRTETRTPLSGDIVVATVEITGKPMFSIVLGLTTTGRTGFDFQPETMRLKTADIKGPGLSVISDDTIARHNETFRTLLLKLLPYGEPVRRKYGTKAALAGAPKEMRDAALEILNNNDIALFKPVVRYEKGEWRHTVEITINAPEKAPHPFVFRIEKSDIFKDGDIPPLYRVWFEVGPYSSVSDTKVATAIVPIVLRFLTGWCHNYSSIWKRWLKTAARRKAAAVKPRTQPGKSPEDALTVIALVPTSDKYRRFTVDGYLRWYETVRMAYPHLKFAPLARKAPHSTARRDLKALVDLGLLKIAGRNPQGARLYVLTEIFRKAVLRKNGELGLDAHRRQLIAGAINALTAVKEIPETVGIAGIRPLIDQVITALKEEAKKVQHQEDVAMRLTDVMSERALDLAGFARRILSAREESFKTPETEALCYAFMQESRAKDLKTPIILKAFARLLLSEKFHQRAAVAFLQLLGIDTASVRGDGDGVLIEGGRWRDAKRHVDHAYLGRAINAELTRLIGLGLSVYNKNRFKQAYALLEFMDDEEPIVRFEAAAAIYLGMGYRGRGISMRDALEPAEYKRLRAAVEEIALPALNDKRDDVVKRALAVLKQAADKKIVGRIDRITADKKERRRGVRQEAARALRYIASEVKTMEDRAIFFHPNDPEDAIMSRKLLDDLGLLSRGTESRYLAWRVLYTIDKARIGGKAKTVFMEDAERLIEIARPEDLRNEEFVEALALIGALEEAPSRTWLSGARPPSIWSAVDRIGQARLVEACIARLKKSLKQSIPSDEYEAEADTVAALLSMINVYATDEELLSLPRLYRVRDLLVVRLDFISNTLGRFEHRLRPYLERVELLTQARAAAKPARQERPRQSTVKGTFNLFFVAVCLGVASRVFKLEPIVTIPVVGITAMVLLLTAFTELLKTPAYFKTYQVSTDDEVEIARYRGFVWYIKDVLSALFHLQFIRLYTLIFHESAHMFMRTSSKPFDERFAYTWQLIWTGLIAKWSLEYAGMDFHRFCVGLALFAVVDIVMHKRQEAKWEAEYGKTAESLAGAFTEVELRTIIATYEPQPGFIGRLFGKRQGPYEIAAASRGGQLQEKLAGHLRDNVGTVKVMRDRHGRLKPSAIGGIRTLERAAAIVHMRSKEMASGRGDEEGDEEYKWLSSTVKGAAWASYAAAASIVVIFSSLYDSMPYVAWASIPAALLLYAHAYAEHRKSRADDVYRPRDMFANRARITGYRGLISYIGDIFSALFHLRFSTFYSLIAHESAHIVARTPSRGLNETAAYAWQFALTTAGIAGLIYYEGIGEAALAVIGLALLFYGDVKLHERVSRARTRSDRLALPLARRFPVYYLERIIEMYEFPGMIHSCRRSIENGNITYEKSILSLYDTLQKELAGYLPLISRSFRAKTDGLGRLNLDSIGGVRTLQKALRARKSMERDAAERIKDVLARSFNQEEITLLYELYKRLSDPKTYRRGAIAVYKEGPEAGLDDRLLDILSRMRCGPETDEADEEGDLFICGFPLLTGLLREMSQKNQGTKELGPAEAAKPATPHLSTVDGAFILAMTAAALAIPAILLSTGMEGAFVATTALLIFNSIAERIKAQIDGRAAVRGPIEIARYRGFVPYLKDIGSALVHLKFSTLYTLVFHESGHLWADIFPKKVAEVIAYTWQLTWTTIATGYSIRYVGENPTYLAAFGVGIVLFNIVDVAMHAWQEKRWERKYSKIAKAIAAHFTAEDITDIITTYEKPWLLSIKEGPVLSPKASALGNLQYKLHNPVLRITSVQTDRLGRVKLSSIGGLKTLKKALAMSKKADRAKILAAAPKLTPPGARPGRPQQSTVDGAFILAMTAAALAIPAILLSTGMEGAFVATTALLIFNSIAERMKAQIDGRAAVRGPIEIARYRGFVPYLKDIGSALVHLKFSTLYTLVFHESGHLWADIFPKKVAEVIAYTWQLTWTTIATGYSIRYVGENPTYLAAFGIGAGLFCLIDVTLHSFSHERAAREGARQETIVTALANTFTPHEFAMLINMYENSSTIAMLKNSAASSVKDEYLALQRILREICDYVFPNMRESLIMDRLGRLKLRPIGGVATLHKAQMRRVDIYKIFEEKFPLIEATLAERFTEEELETLVRIYERINRLQREHKLLRESDGLESDEEVRIHARLKTILLKFGRDTIRVPEILSFFAIGATFLEQTLREAHGRMRRAREEAERTSGEAAATMPGEEAPGEVAGDEGAKATVAGTRLLALSAVVLAFCSAIGLSHVPHIFLVTAVILFFNALAEHIKGVMDGRIGAKGLVHRYEVGEIASYRGPIPYLKDIFSALVHLKFSTLYTLLSHEFGHIFVRTPSKAFNELIVYAWQLFITAKAAVYLIDHIGVAHAYLAAFGIGAGLFCLVDVTLHSFSHERAARKEARQETIVMALANTFTPHEFAMLINMYENTSTIATLKSSAASSVRDEYLALQCILQEICNYVFPNMRESLIMDRLGRLKLRPIGGVATLRKAQMRRVDILRQKLPLIEAALAERFTEEELETLVRIYERIDMMQRGRKLLQESDGLKSDEEVRIHAMLKTILLKFGCDTIRVSSILSFFAIGATRLAQMLREVHGRMWRAREEAERTSGEAAATMPGEGAPGEVAGDEGAKVTARTTAQATVVEAIEWKIDTLQGYGPGSPARQADEDRVKALNASMWEAVNLLHQGRIEIFLPQSMRLTETMERAIRNMKDNKNRDMVNIRIYADLAGSITGGNGLEVMLDRPSEEGVRRIVVANEAAPKEGSYTAISSLAKTNPRLFKATRLINIDLPYGHYSMLETREKTICQARIVMMAILARLYNEGNAVTVGAVLRTLLEEYGMDNSGISKFLANIAEPEGEESLSAITKRILDCLETIVSLVRQKGVELMMMKELWRYA